MLNQQNPMAMLELAQFKRVLPAVIIDKYQDWEFRQRFQYEALKGLIAEDFMSIDDFVACMDATQLNLTDKGAWTTYRPIVLKQNPVFRAHRKILKVPGMGWVGKLIAQHKFAGFTKVFTDAVTIMRDKIKLPGGE